MAQSFRPDQLLTVNKITGNASGAAISGHGAFAAYIRITWYIIKYLTQLDNCRMMQPDVTD